MAAKKYPSSAYIRSYLASRCRPRNPNRNFWTPFTYRQGSHSPPHPSALGLSRGSSIPQSDGWVLSTRTFGSFIRGGPCGASAVYSVSLRLACRGPQRLGIGSCAPFKRWVGRMMSPLSDGGSVFGCPWRGRGEGSTCYFMRMAFEAYVLRNHAS